MAEGIAKAKAPKPHVRGEDVDFSRLCADIRRSRLALRFPREARRDAVLQYVGSHYSEEGCAEDVPINLLALYVSIVGRSLIAKNPRVMLSTFQRAAKPIAAAMESWVNRKLESMAFDRTLQRWAVDALFSVGILKIALATPSDAAHLSWNLRAGEPFAQTIDLDDFVIDMHARDVAEAAYLGHRYRVPLDTVKDSRIYSRARKQLTPSYDPIYNEEGDQRVSVIGRTTYATGTSGEEFEDMVDLWEIYLPRRRLVVTLACDNAGNPEPIGYSEDDGALRVQRWLGPDDGPYHVLGFHTVPGNLLPKAPIQDLYDLHMLANNIYRKLRRQAERQKSLMFWSGSAEGDANRIQMANDGDCPRVDNPDRIKSFDFGGPNQVLLQMFIDTVQRFSTAAGNLEVLGGLSPQSRTATQDKLLNANASGTMASMQDTVIFAVSKAVRAMCWYFKHDPFRLQKSTFSLPGLPEVSAVRGIGPMERRRIPWDELQIQVDPYSLQAQTPQQRLALLQQNLTQIILPMMQLLQAQGISLDAGKVLEKIGKYQDDPDLEEILTLAQPPQPDAPGGGPKPAALPVGGERTTVRENVPMRTQRGDNMNMMNALRGVNPGGAPETGNEGQP